MLKDKPSFVPQKSDDRFRWAKLILLSGFLLASSYLTWTVDGTLEGVAPMLQVLVVAIARL